MPYKQLGIKTLYSSSLYQPSCIRCCIQASPIDFYKVGAFIRRNLLAFYGFTVREPRPSYSSRGNRNNAWDLRPESKFKQVLLYNRFYYLFIIIIIKKLLFKKKLFIYLSLIMSPWPSYWSVTLALPRQTKTA